MATIVAAALWLLGLHAAPSLPHLEPWLGLGLVFAFGALGWLWRGAPAARLAAVGVVFLLFGVLRMQSEAPPTIGSDVATWAHAEEPLELVGRVNAEPLGDARGTRLRVAVEEVRWGENGAAPVAGDVWVTVSAGAWRYGDRVRLVGRLTRPVDRDDVPWAEVMARRGVVATMRVDRAQRLTEPVPADGGLVRLPGAALDTLRGWLYALKSAMGDALDRRLPSPYAGLARGLLLGGTGGMPPDAVESFRRAGLSHVVAVSGYNIALVAGALLPLARLVGGRVGAFVWPALGVLLFTLAVGAPASALRAALMGCLALLARFVGRPADAVAALAVASLAMTALDPGLLHDLGFQLSSLATLGLMALYPWLAERLPFRDPASPALRWLREAVVATLAVELLTVPLIAVTFGRLALLSVAANVVVLPVVPLAMATSFLVAATAPLPDALAAPLGWIAWAPLAWIVAGAEAAAGPDWAAPSIGRVGPALAWGYYGLAAVLLLGLHARSFRRAAPSPAGVARKLVERLPAPVAVGGAFALALTAWSGALAAPDDGLRLTFFENSGAALLRTSGGRAFLFAPGDNGRDLTADLGRTLPFWSSTLDAVGLPRDVPEATLAVPELLRRYRVGQLAVPGAGSDDADWRAAADRSGVAVLPAKEEAAVDLGGGERLVLLPIGAPRPGLSLLVAAGNRRVLVLGDAAVGSQRALAELIDDPVDVVYLPDGGPAALDPALRERADPRTVLVRVRPNLPRPVPRPDDRLQLLRSDERGTIELILRPSGMEIRSRR